MPCNKRSEEAATATKYRKKGCLGHAEDFIPLQVLIYTILDYIVSIIICTYSLTAIITVMIVPIFIDIYRSKTKRLVWFAADEKC